MCVCVCARVCVRVSLRVGWIVGDLHRACALWPGCSGRMGPAAVWRVRVGTAPALLPGLPVYVYGCVCMQVGGWVWVCLWGGGGGGGLCVWGGGGVGGGGGGVCCILK